MRKKAPDLVLSLDVKADKPLQRQIYDAVRVLITGGRLVEGDRLPSIRRTAETNRISHTTVEQAYMQLAAEGYVRGVPRSGYVVEKLDTDYLSMPRIDNTPSVRRAMEDRSRDAFFAENARGAHARYDFSYASLQPDSFPVKTWRRLIDDVMYANTAPDFARYTRTGDPNALSRELARYLGITRGVNALPEQVILQSGTDGAVETILQLFNPREHVVGMEEPGYVTVREVAERLGFRLVPIPSDRGSAAFLQALKDHKPKIVFTTPSHQFPTGNILRLDARTELIKWAQETNAYVIEDDCCNEYRYDTSPIPSLQSLDAYNRVIYLGSVSKVLSPSLRMAYMVLPPKLLGRYFRLFNTAHSAIPWLEQEVLSRFIRDGHWDHHVRRMESGNRRRHDVLLACLQNAFGSAIEISGAHSGMHLYVTVLNGMTQHELTDTALAQGAAVYGTKRFWFSQPAPENNVMVGFSAIRIEDIPDGVAALAKAWL